MTVSSTVARNDFPGTGATDTFAYSFRIFLETHLRVTQRNVSTSVETPLTLAIDYTVAGVGDLTGGTITLLAGNLAVGQVLTIRRLLPLTQDTDIKNGGAFLPETHEDQMDRDVMIAQQQQDEILRSMTLPETIDPTVVSAELPVPVADNFIKWNASATALENAIAATLGTLILPGSNGMAAFTTPGTITARTLTGSGTITVVNGDGVSGNPTFSIPAGGVTSTELGTDSVIAVKIQADAVTTVKILDGNVTAPKLGADSVITVKILDGNVTAPKLGADSVITVKILDLNVTEAKLANGAVTAAKLAAGAAAARAAVETTEQIVGNVATEETIFSKTIAAGAMTVDSLIVFKAMVFSQKSNTAPILTLRLKLGTTTLASLAIVENLATPLVNDHAVEGLIANINNLSVQRGEMTAIFAANTLGLIRPVIAVGTAAEDTSGALNLILTAQWDIAPGNANSVRMRYATAFIV